MDVIQEFVFALGWGKIDDKPLDDAEKKARDAAKRVADEWRKRAKEIGAALAKTAAAAAGLATGLFAVVDRATQAGDEIAKGARSAGLAADEYQRLRFAAESSGASLDAIGKTSRFLQKNLEQARTGAVTPFTAALDEIGVSMQALDAVSFEDRLGIIGDALQGVTDQSRRTALSALLLGEESGPKLASLLAEGTDGIRALGDEAERLGLVMSGDALAASEDFQGQLANVKGEVGALARDLAIEIVPAMRAMIAQFKAWIGENREVLRQRIREFLERFVDGVVRLADALGVVVDAGGKVIETMGGIENAIGAATLAFGAFKLAALGLPGVIAGVGAAVGVVLGKMISDLAGFTQGLADARRELAIIRAQRGRLKSGAEARDELLAMSPEELAALPEAEYEALAADVLAGGVTADAGDDAERVLAVLDRRRAEGRERLESRKALDIFNANLRARTRGGQDKPRGGGRRADTAVDFDAGVFEADELFGEELRALAARHGLGDVAVDASLKAAARSLAEGAHRNVARQAALSRLGGLAGADLTTKGADPLLSTILGDENVPDVELSAIARGAQPQVLVSTINNHFTFDNDFEISGAASPADVANETVQAMRDRFQESIAAASKTVKVVFER